MPELPDIVVYCEALAARMVGQRIGAFRALSPFVLRTAVPPISTIEGRRVVSLNRLGKRIVIGLEDELYLVIHLMIAGRLRWFACAGSSSPGKTPARAKPPSGRQALARMDFDAGSLYLTEAGTRRRASIHLVAGQTGLDLLDPGGLEVLTASFAEFAGRVRAHNHTLKRVMTDPKILSGIGNAYSDEILHRAGLSPMLQTGKVDDEVLHRLFDAIVQTLTEWTERLRAECAANGGFPEKVTAFRPEMAVHGRFGLPCPDCGAPVQRIRYASNETNYCANCQTKGVVLRDRALSRLLKASWPSRLDD